jgi:histidinol-phosphatase (PHP family)
MITADLHSHTLYSHARDSTAAMCAAALARGMAVFGLSEHSLRPAGYSYPTDYQARLEAGFPEYIREVGAQQALYKGRMRVLLALELDYIPAEEAYAREVCAAHPYDYVIGGLHFQGLWGFDYAAGDWAGLSEAACAGHFTRYYQDLERMAETGLFQIAAHPDLVKLFRADTFRRWLEGDEAQERVRAALAAMKKNGMAMELSSAAIRKGLGEPYPGPLIMEIAAGLKLPIAFGSDAHAAGQVAFAFDQLAAYARRFGYSESVWFARRVMRKRPF